MQYCVFLFDATEWATKQCTQIFNKIMIKSPSNEGYLILLLPDEKLCKQWNWVAHED